MFKSVIEHLDKHFPSLQVTDDLKTIITKEKGRIDVDGRSLVIPVETTLDVVAKCMGVSYSGEDNGNRFGALIAVGGVVSQKHNVIIPRYAFSIMWYSEKKELQSVKFSKRYP